MREKEKGERSHLSPQGKEGGKKRFVALSLSKQRESYEKCLPGLQEGGHRSKGYPPIIPSKAKKKIRHREKKGKKERGVRTLSLSDNRLEGTKTPARCGDE